MSVAKWAYSETCEGDYCPGDCDLCCRKIADEDNNAELEETEE